MPFKMLTNIDKLVDSFPYPTVTLIVRILTYDTLVYQIYHISYNATLMQKMLGGGKLGLIVITVSTMVYATLSPTTFVTPPQPWSGAHDPDQCRRNQLDHHQVQVHP